MTTVQPTYHKLPAADAPEDVGSEVPEVSVVIPCLNEARTVATCIDKARRSLDEVGAHYEIILADNGSTDGSQAIAAEHGARVVDVRERGYGSALMGGIAASRGTFVIMGDADDSYDFSDLGPFVAKLRAGFDLVVGNRFRGGIRTGAMPLSHRYLGNPFLTSVGKRFYGTPCGDIYCGLRGFRKSAIESLNLQSTGMEFAIEMLVKASFSGIATAEVPTTLSPDGRDRAPHLRTWRDGWRSIRLLLLYSPTWLFFYPGVALMVIGAALMLWLLPSQRAIGSVALDAHTLLYGGLAVVVGFQAVVFSVLASAFAIAERLLPPDARFGRLIRGLTLERGVLAGAVLIAAGFAATLVAIVIWSQRSFGRLDYADTLRIVVPASVLIVVGSQTVLASFFLAVLQMRRR